MSTTDINEFIAVTKLAWTKETSNNENWTPDKPTLGQCAVTALLVNDYLEFNIVNRIATLPNGTEESHYCNEIYGEIFDLTKDQFPSGTSFSDPTPRTQGFPTTRDYLLSNPNTKSRYEILSARVKHLLER